MFVIDTFCYNHLYLLVFNYQKYRSTEQQADHLTAFYDKLLLVLQRTQLKVKLKIQTLTRELWEWLMYSLLGLLWGRGL